MRVRYFAMLSASSGDDAYATVKRAGSDVATPALYRALLARMSHAMDQLGLLLAQEQYPIAGLVARARAKTGRYQSWRGGALAIRS